MKKQEGMRGVRGVGVDTTKVEVPRSNLGAARRAREEQEERDRLQKLQDEKIKAENDRLMRAEVEREQARIRKATAAAPLGMQTAMDRIASSVFGGVVTGRVSAAGVNPASIPRQNMPSFAGRAERIAATIGNTRVEDEFSWHNAAMGVMDSGVPSATRSTTAINSTVSNLGNLVGAVAAIARSPLDNINDGAPALRVDCLSLPTGQRMAIEIGPQRENQQYMRMPVDSTRAMDDADLEDTVVSGFISYLNSARIELRGLSVNVTPVAVERERDLMRMQDIYQSTVPSTTVIMHGIGTPAELTEAATQRLLGSMRTAAESRARRGRTNHEITFSEQVTVGRNSRWVCIMRGRGANSGLADSRSSYVLVLSKLCDSVSFTTSFDATTATQDAENIAMGAAIRYICELRN